MTCQSAMPLSASVIASEYGSWPLAHPALQISHRLARRPQRRQHVRRERVELPGVAEERRLLHRDPVQQLLQPLGVGLEPGDVGRPRPRRGARPGRARRAPAGRGWRGRGGGRRGGRAAGPRRRARGRRSWPQRPHDRARRSGRAARTCAAAPRRCAARGMPNTTDVASSWAMVTSPRRRRASRPAAPSSPMPVSSTPTLRAARRARRATRTARRPTAGAASPGRGSSTMRSSRADPEVGVARARCRRRPAGAARRGAASSTGSGETRAIHDTSPPTKSGWRCWTTSTLAPRPPSPPRTSASAAGPPVDAPMATIGRGRRPALAPRSPGRAARASRRAGMADDGDAADEPHLGAQRLPRRPRSIAPAWAARRPRRPRARRPPPPTRGRRRSPTARGSASGANAMICSMTCWPPPPGICRSRVTTSGRSVLHERDGLDRASAASPTTVMSPSASQRPHEVGPLRGRVLDDDDARSPSSARAAARRRTAGPPRRTRS